MSETSKSKKKPTDSKSIEKALATLASIEEPKRVKAVKYLANSNDPRVIHSLQKVAEGDQSLQIRFIAKEGLQQIRASLTQKIGINFTDETTKANSNILPVNLKKLAKALESESTKERSNAVKAAMAYLNPQALNVIIPHLKKEREIKVKRNCIMAIGILGDKTHVPLLLHYLEHKEPHYRLKAIGGLGCLTEISTYPRLVNSIGDKNKHVRHAALATVLKLGKPKVLKLFYKMVTSKHKWMKVAAAKACGKLKSSKVIQILATCLSDKDEDVRKAARTSLRKLEKQGVKLASKLLETYKKAGGEVTLENFTLPSDVDSLACLLNDEDPKKRNAEIQRMVEDKDTSLIEMAIARLDVEKDEHVLSSLIIAIGRLHGVNAIKHVTRFLKASNQRLVASAVEALSFIDSPAVVPLLTPFLDSDDNRTCANAIVALKDTPEANIIEPLKKLARHDERNYKLSAIYAILEIHTPEATGILDLMEGSLDKIISERLSKAREILSDTAFSSPQVDKKRQSSELEIPIELTVKSPEEDAGISDTKENKVINADSVTGSNNGDEDDDDDYDEDDIDNTDAGLDDTDASITDSTEGDSSRLDDTTPPVRDSKSPPESDKKSGPGFRTQIDQMFVAAEKAPIKKIKPQKKLSKKIDNAPPSSEGLLDQISKLLTPKDEPATTTDGGTNPSNIIIICVGVVVAFLVIYMLTSGGGDGIDDDFYSNDDF